MLLAKSAGNVANMRYYTFDAHIEKRFAAQRICRRTGKQCIHYHIISEDDRTVHFSIYVKTNTSVEYIIKFKIKMKNKK